MFQNFFFPDNVMDLLSKMNMNDSDSQVEKVSQLIKLVCELSKLLLTNITYLSTLEYNILPFCLKL